MTVSLLIPTGFKDRRRHEIFLWVMARWMKQFPNWQICLGTDDPCDYNRSRGRNDAFRQADGDILVITDADTVTDVDNVKSALEIATRTKSWVIAHKLYYSLTKEYTDFILKEDPEVKVTGSVLNSNWVMKDKSEAGVLVMPREAYEAVEGYDERFNGWGYEDNAFATKLRQKWGEPQRTQGSVLHLWHDPGLNFAQPHITENEALLEEIRNAV